MIKWKVKGKDFSCVKNCVESATHDIVAFLAVADFHEKMGNNPINPSFLQKKNAIVVSVWKKTFFKKEKKKFAVWGTKMPKESQTATNIIWKTEELEIQTLWTKIKRLLSLREKALD